MEDWKKPIFYWSTEQRSLRFENLIFTGIIILTNFVLDELIQVPLETKSNFGIALNEETGAEVLGIFTTIRANCVRSVVTANLAFRERGVIWKSRIAKLDDGISAPEFRRGVDVVKTFRMQ